ncbi:GNAT family N-acetyltransferase [Alkalibacillus salilacus]|uniref:Diamine N-acetyltransferase n=1 Tax=Alkalibacillus salilacus TaxID=284582 RepID=A0ABT9VEQ7_9BACI|nr:GNAT family N-acetyltransferase [Alkalibacillus salilacus]MDQ0159457.1 diamine N-acetyltransferase [Alkalibacillus salilacus]
MSEQLSIQPLQKDDLDFLYQMRINSDVMDYWFEEPYASKAQMIKSYEANLEQDSHRSFILYHGKEKIGYLGLFDLDWRHRHAEFAIMIDPAFQGNGYATRATELMIDYGFNQLNLHKLFLYVAQTNEKAAYIYEKVGFEREGFLKQHFFINGQYCDVIMMGLLQENIVSNKN